METGTDESDEDGKINVKTHGKSKEAGSGTIVNGKENIPEFDPKTGIETETQRYKETRKGT